MHKLYKAPFGIVMPALVLMLMAAILWQPVLLSKDNAI